MIPPTPFTRKGAPIRSGAAPCTLLAKNDFLSPWSGFRNTSGGAVSAGLSIRNLKRDRKACSDRTKEIPRGMGIETITSRYLRRRVPELKVAAISTPRGRRHRRFLGHIRSSDGGFLQMGRIPLRNDAGQMPALC